jgi:ferric enterobactin receptor
MILKKLLVLFVLSMPVLFTYGQTPAKKQDPSKIMVADEFYDDKPLAFILNDLQKKYPVKFDYDPEGMGSERISYWFYSVSMAKGIKEALKTSDYKFTIDPTDFVIKIEPKKRLEQKTLTKFTGEPTRKNFTLSGRVTDASTGENLPFANVGILGTKIGAQTNVDGVFTLLKVPSDTATLLVSYVGYKTLKYYLNPKMSFENFAIVLESTTTLDEVTVKGEKTEVMKANEVVGMIKMTPRNIAKLPNVGERDPFRAFQLMPGVSASNESSSGLYVRGGTPDQTLVLYDGFTVYHVDHLFGFFSAFNYNAIKDIQLYKGGFDAKFGGRISGVAEITGKEGNKNDINAGIDVGFLSMNGYLETPIGNKLTFLLAARRSWESPLYNSIFSKFGGSNDNNANPIPAGGGGRFGAFSQNQTAASYFYDLNSKLTFRPSKKDIISLSLYNGTDDMDNSSSSSFGGGGGPFGGGGGGALAGLRSSTNDVSSWGNTGGSFKWSRQWGDRFYSNALVSYSNYFSNRDNTRTITIQNNGTDRNIKLGNLETNDLTDFTAKIDFEYKLSASQQLEFGAQFSKTNIKYSYSQNDTVKVLDRDDKGDITSVYLQDKIELFDGKLTLKPGIRYNYFSVNSKSYFEPRLSFNYNLNKSIKLKGAVGTYYQFNKQVFREDLSAGNRNFWILANGDNLPVTQSNHLIFGGSYEKGDYLFDVEYYRKQNTGVTEYTLRFAQRIGSGTRAEENFFNGDETIEGIDFLVQRKFGRFTGWLGYTYSVAQRNIAAFSDKPYYSDQDVRNQFKAVASYKIGKFDLAATWIFSTGRPYTSILGAYQVKLLDGTTRDFTNPSDKNANRFDDYHRMDISATMNVSSTFNVALSFFNLYNRQNIWYKRFEIVNEDNKSYLNTVNVNYLGFTPNLTLTWKLK